jgi:hypothetical protein
LASEFLRLDWLLRNVVSKGADNTMLHDMEFLASNSLPVDVENR